MYESPFTVQPSKKSRAVVKSQERMREMKRRFNGFKSQVEKMSWNKMVNRIIENSATPEIAQKKREILKRLSLNRLQQEFNLSVKIKIKKMHTFRGYLFEYLVGLEMVDDDQDVETARCVLDCLKHPGKLDLDLPSQKNPDHLGVVVDSETGEIYITGMYEVKLQKLTHSGERQIKHFYYNLRLIVATMNQMIAVGKTGKNMKSFPNKKMYLKPVEEMYKYVVISYPDTEEEKQVIEGRNKQLAERDWSIKPSVFSLDDVDLMSAYILKNTK